jgi:hypothetical protein
LAEVSVALTQKSEEESHEKRNMNAVPKSQVRKKAEMGA